MNRMLDCAPFSVMWLKAPSCAQLPRRVSDTPPLRPKRRGCLGGGGSCVGECLFLRICSRIRTQFAVLILLVSQFAVVAFPC